MTSSNPYRDPALARPAILGAGVHVNFAVVWIDGLRSHHADSSYSGWYYAQRIDTTGDKVQDFPCHDQPAWHGPHLTDHGAYDAAVEALS